MDTPTILIVDDEPAIGSMLKMLLQCANPRCNIQSFTNPLSLLEAIPNQTPNLVISDFRMPEMSGTELLENVRKTSPATIRLLMSGYMAQLAKVGSAHQFIAKPFQPKETVLKVHRAISIQANFQSNPALVKLVTGLQSLPVIPVVFTQLMALLEQTESSLQDIANLLAQDGGMLTRVIQLANSPLFQRGDPVTSAVDAILVLGLQNIKAIVLSLHLFNNYNQLNFQPIKPEQLWSHCWKVGTIAQRLCCKYHGAQFSNDAFFAGILHDLGQLILMENRPQQYMATYEKAVKTKQSLACVEKQEFGLTSQELCSFLAQLWGLSPSVTNAIAHHEAPWMLPHTGFNAGDAVYLANLLVRQQNAYDVFHTPDPDVQYLRSITNGKYDNEDCCILNRF